MKLRAYAVVGGLLLAVQTLTAEEAAPKTATGKTINIQTVDYDTGAAIVGVQIEVMIGAKQPEAKQDAARQPRYIQPKQSVKETDVAGRCQVEFESEKASFIRLTAAKKGLVATPHETQWQPNWADLPDSFTFKLERGVVIGGIIQDEQGKPIEGAEIELQLPNVPGKNTAMVWIEKITTDQNGHWETDVISPRLTEILIQLKHRAYISDAYAERRAPNQQLREKKAVFVMKKGIAVYGRVLDETSKPIPNANVRLGEYLPSDLPKTETGSEGRFQLLNVAPEETLLTVQADAYAPEQIKFTPRLDLDPLEIRLKKSPGLHLRIVDKNGKPIPRAWMIVDSWRENHAGGFNGILDWKAYADAEGRLRWSGAPTDVAKYRVSAPGFTERRDIPLKASDQEQVIILGGARKVHGAVVDAETGQPIAKFKVVQGSVTDVAAQLKQYEESYKDLKEAAPGALEKLKAKLQEQVSWNDYWTGQSKDGKYDTTFSEDKGSFLIRIEAEGYEPAVSRQIKSDEGEVTFDFKLKKGEWLKCVVLGPDGKPVASAKVTKTTGGMGIMFQNGQLESADSSFEADREGKFSLAPRTEMFKFVVAEKEGYAEINSDDFAKSRTIKLQAWGRVEGVLKRGDQPVTSELLELSNMYGGSDAASQKDSQKYGAVYHSFQTTTDASGRFAFERVPPGKIQLNRVQQTKVGGAINQILSTIALLDVKAGETTRFNVGGSGRAIVGKVTFSPDAKEKVDLKQASIYVAKKTAQSNVWDEKSIEKMSDADIKKAILDSVEEGKKTGYAVQPVGTFAEVRADGTFRVDDIPPGKYSLSISIYPPRDSLKIEEATVSADGTITTPGIESSWSAGKDFDVTEGTGTPIDLGALEMKPATPYKMSERVERIYKELAPQIEKLIGEGTKE